jgi:hypothetical protein
MELNIVGADPDFEPASENRMAETFCPHGQIGLFPCRFGFLIT